MPVEKMPGRLRQCPCCKSRAHAVHVYHETHRPTKTFLYPDRYAYCTKCKIFFTCPPVEGIVKDVSAVIVAEYNKIYEAWILRKGIPA
jgi:hypothetical protein